jgi:hypothetical protein
MQMRTTGVLLALVFLLGGAETRAGLIFFTFTASGGGTINDDPAYSTHGVTGTITVAPTAGTGSGDAILEPTGGKVDPFTIGTYTQSTDAVSPTQFVYFDSTETLSVTITDSASQGETFKTTLSFTGYTAGNYTALAPSVSPSPTTFDLGSYEYSVYYLATQSTGAQTGSIQVGLEATSISSSTPEPSSFILFGMGVTGLGVARWRKRNQTAV